jgi:hypothetical protein
LQGAHNEPHTAQRRYALRIGKINLGQDRHTPEKGGSDIRARLSERMKIEF